MADPMRGDIKGLGQSDHATSAAAVQAEFERRARAKDQGFAAAGPAPRQRADRLGDADSVQSAAESFRRPSADQPRPAAPTFDVLKDQAVEAAFEARGTVLNLAEEARHRLVDLAAQQKDAGADRLAAVARAAAGAAGDLDASNPQMAQLVRTAAGGVSRMAETIKSRDPEDILASVTAFGRRRPVAFFGGAVLAGFVLARIFKIDAPSAASETSLSPTSGI